MAEDPIASPAAPGASPLRGLLLVLAVSATLLFAFLGSRDVCNPDEPREAETAREAAEGHWTVAPEVNGYPFRERPPLYYWMVALVFRAAGEPGDGSARVVSALLGVVAVFSVWLLGESLIGRARGWLPALLLLGTPVFFLKFRVCITDTGLTAFTALSLALFFTAWKRDSRTIAAAAGAASGLAFLCKGLLGFGIPAVVALAWLAWKRDLRAILRLRLWLTVLVGLAMIAPWLWAVHRQQGPEWLNAFFVVQHFGRLGGTADHAQPPWFYVRILWVALPLTPLLLAGFAHGGRQDRPGRDGYFAGALWVGALLLVLSAVGGKRNVYLLPLLPGAALAAAGAVEMAAAGGLGARGRKTVERTIAVLEALTLQFLLPRGRGLRVRAAAAALGVAGLALLADALVLASLSRERSGYSFAARAAALAGDRPLVLFRVGEGDVGQFAFALRRRIPLAWTETRLLFLFGGRSGVVLAEGRVFDDAVLAGELSPGTLASLRRIEEGSANEDTYYLLEWSGASGSATPPVPPGER